MAESESSRLDIDDLWEYKSLILWGSAILALVIIIGPSTIFWLGLLIIVLLFLYFLYYLYTGEL